MRYRQIIEAHHAYDSPDYKTPFQPVRAGDTFRVFHGFRDLPDAVEACRVGLSGAGRAPRVYSYESDNNPKGLFVSVSFDVCKEFGSTIIEFACALDELEAPVWPGGGYTVQGQMAQYFGRGPDGRAARRQRAKHAEKEIEDHLGTRDDIDHVRQSDPGKRYLANTLLNSREYQALFIGHLDPSRIAAVFIKDDPKKDGRWTTWSKLTREEFLERNPPEGKKPREKLFGPAEDFSEAQFYQRLNTVYGYLKNGQEDFDQTLANIWAGIRKSKRPLASFLDTFGHWFYPKQLPQAFNWFKRRFKDARE